MVAMMNKSAELAQLMGLLVQKNRADRMDQTELGLRMGVGRGTISKLESGQGIKTSTLFDALEKLDCIEPIIAVVSDLLEDVQTNPQRKRRKTRPELSNDF